MNTPPREDETHGRLSNIAKQHNEVKQSNFSIGVAVVETYSTKLGVQWPVDHKAPAIWNWIGSDAQPIIYVLEWQPQSPNQLLLLMLTTVFSLSRLRK